MILLGWICASISAILLAFVFGNISTIITVMVIALLTAFPLAYYDLKRNA